MISTQHPRGDYSVPSPRFAKGSAVSCARPTMQAFTYPVLHNLLKLISASLPNRLFHSGDAIRLQSTTFTVNIRLKSREWSILCIRKRNAIKHTGLVVSVVKLLTILCQYSERLQTDFNRFNDLSTKCQDKICLLFTGDEMPGYKRDSLQLSVISCLQAAYKQKRSQTQKGTSVIYPVDPGLCRYLSEARLYRYLTDGGPRCHCKRV
ncbi:hypothetical protein LSTR_LSTR009312 [Laodelphax striatellus]|uniref:Uncharacterized protein n=1 Tax=Laodelphax striatellus TaxID=195883 RepID=A0A482XJI8_LAOST|nr:hypothetical protein LSTR_LSTR009312 [Laodelphax striatellus]